MALQSSGEIKFSQIINEFGDSSPNTPGSSLGNYRVSESYGEMYNIPLDRGIPKPTTENPSPSIRFSDFYGKRLNMVVNFYDNLNNGGGANVVGKQNMKAKFNTPGKVKVVGGFLQPPSTTSGKRVIINVSKIIAPRTSTSYNQPSGSSGYSWSPYNDRNEVSMKTGNWDPNTLLELYIGGSGKIVGAGGAGGKNGHSRGGRNGPGDRGTSALGVTYPLDIYNYGYIAGGGGGGGGSPYYKSDRSRESYRRRRFFGLFRSTGRRRSVRTANGSPGGGGAGYSGLAPNAINNNQYGGPAGLARQRGNAGQAGTLTTGGVGGASQGRGAVAGGAGGDLGQAGVSIDGRGAGGDAGHAIIISGSGSATVIEGSNNVLGGIHNGQFTDF